MGFETSGFEQRSGDVVRQAAEDEGGAAEVLAPLADGFQAELVEAAGLREVRALKVAWGTSKSSVGRCAYGAPSWKTPDAQPEIATHLDSAIPQLRSAAFPAQTSGADDGQRDSANQ